MMDRFAYLEYGLSAVLVFIGAKMLASRWVHVPALGSLAVVILLLGSAIAFSLWKSRRDIPESEAIVKAKEDD
jgi:tellurite resistance protein TerC